MKLKNGWRRWTTPTTIKRHRSHVIPVVRGGAQPQPLPREDYEQPEVDLVKAERDNKLRRAKIRRSQMGDAKNIVGSDKKKPAPITDIGSRKKSQTSAGMEAGSVIERLGVMSDDLDRAIEIKQHDLDVEGPSMAPENHFKLGVLRAADSLVRRARALLEDYGTDLQNDVDPTEDEKAAGGDEFEKDDPEDD